MDSETLRELFNRNAKNYDTYRPGYPDEVFVEILRRTNLSKDAKILEIGSGTGQASYYFAEFGFDLTCVEIGSDLARLTQKKLSSFPNVSVQNVAFEDFSSPSESFNLIISATAFHWISREISYSKCFEFLNSDGYLAIFRNFHPMISPEFFELERKLNNEVVPGWSDNDDESPLEDKIAIELDYLSNSEFFEKVEVVRIAWSRKYTSSEYAGLLGTYSNYLRLSQIQKTVLFQKLVNLIDIHFGGNLTKPYITVLYLAKKRSISHA